jgi:hypothetical protein
MKQDITYEYFGCKSIEDILAKWSTGSELGTKMHNHFEDLANLVEYARATGDTLPVVAEYMNTKVDPGYKEVEYFWKFMEEMGVDGKKRSFWRTEFLMWHDVLHISGMIDGILYDHEKDHYIIIDYKRLGKGLTMDPENPKKTVDQLAPSSRGKYLPSFMRLRKNDQNKYGCQLTMYKHMFEHMFPDKKIGAMYLIVVTSSKIGKPDALKIHEVPLNKYDQCIKEVLIHRAEDILRLYADTMPRALARKVMEFLPVVEDQPDPSTIPSVFSSDEEDNT